MAKPYTLKMKIKHIVIRILMTFFSLCPINRHKVVMCNYFGKGYGDNGKAITEALLEKQPNLDIVWGTDIKFKNSLPRSVRFVRYNSVKYLWELATAAAWVDNSRKNAGIRKRRKQFYVQTWHGTAALKRIEKDVECNLDEFYVVAAKNDSKMANIILSGCRFFTELCRRAFWFDGEILECGSPRSDALFNIDDKKKFEVRKTLNIPDNKKIALYAPTFRADGNLECYNLDYSAVLKALFEKTGDEWVFCIRLHPNISEKSDFIKYSDRIINATNYPDLYELIPVCDLVISDYSSLMFDAGIINKIVMLFANDVDSYAADRNFYFDVRKLPFPLAENNQEILNVIKTFDSSKYLRELEHFNNEVIAFCENGTAAKTVAERILKEING